MKSVHYKGTLFYYDGPQVFEARDAIGGHYAAVAVEPDVRPLSELPSSEGRERYLVVGVAPEQLRLFRGGEVDLHSLLVGSEEDERYTATTSAGIDGPLQLERLTGSLLDSGMLPDPGFLLHDRPSDGLVKEARQRNNLVLEVVAEPPEAATEHRIHAVTLAGLLQHVQTMVRSAHRAARKENPFAARQPNQDLLDVVVPAAAGSFCVLLEAAQNLDLLGKSEIATALPRVDRLFEHAASPDDTLAVIKENRGHLAGAYLKFLRFLEETQTGVHYSWALPNSEQPTIRGVAKRQAAPLVEVLSHVQKLGSEPITLEGTLEKFNRNTGMWGLLTAEGARSGKIEDGGPSLDGLEVGGSYRFYCDDEIKEVSVTGEEKHVLHLNRQEKWSVVERVARAITGVAEGVAETDGKESTA